MNAAYDLIERLKKLFGTTDVRSELILASARVAGIKAEELVSEYPIASGKPLAAIYERNTSDGRTIRSKFKTIRQQRKVFALIRQGSIPYRRTGALGRSITSNARYENGKVIIVLGSNLDYAPLVLDEELQSHYHQGTWTPLQMLVVQNRKVIIDAFEKDLIRRVNDYVKGS